MIETRECGCRSVFDGQLNAVSVSTCNLCLPEGVITWLIENGRQLDLFGDRGVLTPMRGLESIEKSARDQVQPLERFPLEVHEAFE